MQRATPSRSPRPALVVLLFCFLLAGPAAAEPAPDQHEKRRLKAADRERRGEWLEACRAWEDILRKDRQNPIAREGYQRCLRRLHMAVRHADPTYRQTLARLAPSQALEAYEQVLTILHVGHPDRARTNYATLFRQGLLELRTALDEAIFKKHHLPGARVSALEAFKARLTSLASRPIGSRGEAREQAMEAILAAAEDGLSLRLSSVSAMIMEFAAGACGSLDDHSSFLAPGHLSLVQAALRGKLVGVGVEVGVDDDHIRITRVYAKGPAAEAGLQVGDRVVRVGGFDVASLPADAVAERLRGDPGSAVEVEVEREAWDGKRTLRLVRRTVHVTSVEVSRPSPLNDGTVVGLPVGYIKIHHFQDSTPHEVREAILELSSSPDVKGIILDLRGNPGGVFKAAVAVAELFVSGVIVVGQSPFKDYNKPFRSETADPVNLPMVVLIDADTASAAEVLAGALQGGRPATKLLGQTTYGKGSIQCIVPMEKGPLDGIAGLRLTVAKLFSPSNQPYSGRGVVPDVPSAEKGDGLIVEARKVLLELLKPGLPVMPPPRVVARDMGGAA